MTRVQAMATNLVMLMPILFVSYPVIADDAQSLTSATINTSSVISINLATNDADISSEEEIRRLFELYRDARSAGMLEEADTLAKRIVDLSIRAYGIDNKVTALALTNLAALQSSNEDNISAVQNFAQAIEIVERLDSRLSSDLISPLRGMGAAYLLAGNADHAQAAGNRALHISHVNFGPHNFEQVETLYSLGRSFMNAGMPRRRSGSASEYRFFDIAMPTRAASENCRNNRTNSIKCVAEQPGTGRRRHSQWNVPVIHDIEPVNPRTRMG